MAKFKGGYSCNAKSGLPIMAKGYLGVCFRTSPVPVGGYPAGQDYTSEQARSEVEYYLV